MVKAVVMDFDGLIFDTESVHYDIYQHYFQERGAELPLEQWAEGVGTQGKVAPARWLGEQLGRAVDEDAMEAYHWREVARRLEQRTEPRSGVRDLLDQADQLGMPLAVASSSPREWVERWLRHLQLRQRFKTVCTRDDVERVKPDPALYRLAAERLGVHPENLLVFEDSVNGSQAALAAGARCVVVPNRVTKHMDFDPVCRQLATFRGLDLEALLQELER